MKSSAVIIVGPPWPRSGTARVIENQIQFYRSRGYVTVFLGVPIHRAYIKAGKNWEDLTAGVQDLGADHIAIAALDRKSYEIAKYTSSLRHALRGTVLDWIVDIGRSAQLPDDTVRLIRELPVSLVHVNHVYTVGFTERLLRQSICSGDRVPIVLETHDIQSQLLQERGDLNPWVNRPDSLERLIHCETKLLKRANVLVHLSVDDFKYFQTQLPSTPHILAMPTIDEAFVSAVNAESPSATEPIDLLFVGQSHGANLAGLKWFFEQVWPLIAGRRYNIKIVGAVDLFVRQSLPQTYETFRTSFVGPVADLAPYYRAARCVFAPMVSGSGISIKTIEALSLAKPFVGTSKAFRGMPMDRIERAGLRAHDEPQAFADAIARVLSAEVSEGALSRAAYDGIFSIQAAFAARDEAVRIATGMSGDQKEGFASAIIPSS